jgi:hypothetical protein
MLKIELTFFMNRNENIPIYRFLRLFNSAHFLLPKDDQIFKRLSLEHKELRSVEIFPSILYSSKDINIYSFLFFSNMCDNSVMAYVETFMFSYFEIYTMRSIKNRDGLFLSD